MTGRSFNVQKNGTPRRKPRKRGGSPSGVKRPPMLLTRKMKKTMTCALFFRQAFALSTVRMRIIDAPVVPMNDAITVPMARSATFERGRPAEPPLDVYSARHCEQSPEKDDERDVLVDVGPEELGKPCASVCDDERYRDDDPPERGHFGKVAVPPVRREKREERDRKENSREGNRRPDGKDFADRRGLCCAGCGMCERDAHGKTQRRRSRRREVAARRDMG